MSEPAIRFTLRQLQLFVAVARTGKISLAAVESHVTQSTMTAAIAELERLLGSILFERGRTGVALTYEGHIFLQNANSVLEAAGEAARHPFWQSEGVTGELEVAASYTVLGYFLLPFIARYQKRHPGVRIIPIEQERRQLEARVAEGSIEMAVALTSNLENPDAFERCVLVRSRRQLWVPAALPLAQLSEVSMRDVARYPYILPLVDEGEISGVRNWERAGLSPVSFLYTSSMEAVREMVALGLGLTILSDMIFRPWSLDGRPIRCISLTDSIPSMEVGVIWRKGHILSASAQSFMKYLAVSVAANAADSR